jgi:hypothetical protein
MFRVLDQRFPEIYKHNYVVSVYGDPTPLIVGAHGGTAGERDLVCDECTTGRPLGSFLFCITVQPLLSAVREQFCVDILAIADDVVIAGTVVACRDAGIDGAGRAQIGFYINPTKSTALAPGAHGHPASPVLR